MREIANEVGMDNICTIRAASSADKEWVRNNGGLIKQPKKKKK